MIKFLHSLMHPIVKRNSFERDDFSSVLNSFAKTNPLDDKLRNRLWGLFENREIEASLDDIKKIVTR